MLNNASNAKSQTYYLPNHAKLNKAKPGFVVIRHPTSTTLLNSYPLCLLDVLLNFMTD